MSTTAYKQNRAAREMVRIVLVAPKTTVDQVDAFGLPRGAASRTSALLALIALGLDAASTEHRKAG